MEKLSDWISEYGNISAQEFAERFSYPFLVYSIVAKKTGNKQESKKEQAFTMELNMAELASEQSPTIAYDLVKEVKKTTKYDKKIITIGRTDKTDIFFDSKAVSQLHAFIQFNEQQQTYCITDCNSTNGSWLNQEKLLPRKEKALRDRDQIVFSQTVHIKYFSAYAFHSYMVFQSRLKA